MYARSKHSDKTAHIHKQCSAMAVIFAPFDIKFPNVPLCLGSVGHCPMKFASVFLLFHNSTGKSFQFVAICGLCGIGVYGATHKISVLT